MYKSIIRPILFLFPAELVHRLVSWTIKFFFKIPGIPQLMRQLYVIRNPHLSRVVAGLKFDNPVGLAAGFDKNALLFNEFSNFGFSFVEIGTVTPKAQSGNPKPRLFRLPKDKALINRMGINNQGVDKIVKRLKKRNANVLVGGNIGKNTITLTSEAINDYIRCFKKLYNYVDYFVVNISCPNISNASELQDKAFILRLLLRLVDLRTNMVVKRPIFLKIAPDLNFNQIDDVIDIVKRSQIDGIVATNTTIKRQHLNTPFEKVTSIGNGGLSGKPINKRSTEMIRYICEKSRNSFPVIGAGGIITPEDALEKLNAGASLVQLYTGFIYEGPGIVKRINQFLLKNQKY